jgi:RHS repeat-associated protein
VALTNAGKTIVNKYAYTPFGVITGQTEAIAQPFKYAGQHGVMAESNGFYYMRARYYDPQVKRFISEDPLGFGGGDLNLYAYVGNNPVMGVDPWGLKLNVPSFSSAYPNSTFVAPVADIVLGSHELAGGIVSGIGAVILTASGPETWILAAPLATVTPGLISDGTKRINSGVAALEARNSYPTTNTSTNANANIRSCP